MLYFVRQIVLYYRWLDLSGPKTGSCPRSVHVL